MRGEVKVDRCNLGSCFTTDCYRPGSNSEAKEVAKSRRRAGSRTLATYSRTADAALVGTGIALPLSKTEVFTRGPKLAIFLFLSGRAEAVLLQAGYKIAPNASRAAHDRPPHQCVRSCPPLCSNAEPSEN
jgi:hypothetical protein